MDNTESQKKKKSISYKIQKARSKFLGAYYGNPIRDMKLVCITGSTGRSVVAKLVHEILKASGQHAAVLASEGEIKAGVLNKFFADAWKAGANFVVVTAPAESLRANVFYGLPVAVAAVTDYLPSTLDSMSYEEWTEAVEELFQAKPDYVILNADDKSYQDFSKFSGKKNTYTYGKSMGASVKINTSKLYRKGVEVNLGIGSSYFTTASFLTGEPSVSYMACASAVAVALNIASGPIIEGMANYTEEETEE